MNKHVGLLAPVELTPDAINSIAFALASGVIRKLENKKPLDIGTEQSVSTGVLTTQEDSDDAQ